MQQTELEKYRNLAQACLDYCLTYPLFDIKSEEFDSESHFKNCKVEVEELFEKGNLKRLIQISKDLIEPFNATSDAAFNKYIIEKIGIDLGIKGVDLTKSNQYNEKIESILTKGKIENREEATEVRGFICNPYNRIDEVLEKELESMLLLYEYTVLRDENGERYSQIERRNKSKRRRKFESYSIICKMSPDNMKVAIVDEHHEKDKLGTTTINLCYALGGGNIVHAYGLNLGINIQWINKEKLLVEVPKDVKITKQESESGMKEDIVLIEYVTK